MVLDGLRGYLELANGLTDVTRDRARAAAKSLVAQGEASVGAVLPDSFKAQVSSLTDDLIATSKANRALLIGLVSSEVERATGRLGLAMAGELESAQKRMQRLERKLADLEHELRESLAQAPPAAAPKAAKKSARKTAKKSTAKKSTAKKSTARRSPAKKTAADKTTEATVAPTTAPPAEPSAGNQTT